MSGEKHDVVIIGASAAGLRCACRLTRLRPERSIVVVEAREEFSFAACGLPYALSGDIDDLDDLRRTADGSLRDSGYFAAAKGVSVLSGWRATDIDPDARTVRIEDKGGTARTLGWEDLVLATGAHPRHLPGQPDHRRVVTFHHADDVRPLRQALARGEIGRAVIIGAGPLGCELSESFGALWGADVTLLEAALHPLPGLLDPEAAAIVAHTLRSNDVDLRTGVRVEGIEARDDGVTVRIAGGDPVAGDVVVVAVGVEPAVELAAAAGLRLGPTGGIAVDERLATSVPGIWAAGDAVEVRHVVTGEPLRAPLGSLANRQGRALANILAGGEDRFGRVAAAAAVKVFDLNVAAVGLTRAAARRRGDDVRSVWIAAHDRAHYWPESAEIALQLTWETASGRVVGVQAVGEGDVTKRIDVATQLLHRGVGIDGFAALEHAYSPPYAPALDPLAVAGMVALNVADGVEARGPLADLGGGDGVLDVRHDDETAARPLGTARAEHVPQEDLRERQAEIAPRTWTVVCERGTRSAEVVRWLRGRGVTAAYLGGGLRWRSLAGRDAGPETTAGT